MKPLSSGLDVGGERQLCFPFSCITANHLALCLGGAHPLFYRSPDTFILGPRLGEVNVNKDKNSGGESNPKEKMTQQPPFSSYLILMTMANSVCVRERRKHSQRDPSPFFVRVAAGSKSAAYCPGTCIRTHLPSTKQAVYFLCTARIYMTIQKISPLTESTAHSCTC